MSASQASTPTGERRHVTVVFSDLSGYTALSESRDPEEIHEITGEIFAAIGSVVERMGGRTDRLLGDAILAVFGDPIAHEDDAERAVRAALEFHKRVEALRLPATTSGESLRLHTGINTGVVVTGGRVLEVATGPLGDTVNIASRLQSLAQPGEILVGASTASLVAGIFDVEDAGVHTLKGKAEPVKVTRVRGVATQRTGPSRRHGNFIGRQEELGVLLGALERARDGSGSVVTIVGDAGAGKTRLIGELRQRAGEDVLWLEGRAYAHGQHIPYAPFIDLISRVALIDEGATPEEVRARLSDVISGVLPEDAEDLVGPLLRLFAIETPEEAAADRESFHSRLFHALIRVVDTLASQATTVVCLQDLHWADPSTMSMTKQLVERMSAPLLVVCNTRPGPTLGAEDHIIQLSELSPRQTRELVASLLDDPEPPASLVSFVESRADGNPFFVEEIVNSLIDMGSLVRSAAGWSLPSGIQEASVPSTIRGVIAARIDNLDDDRKRVLREAAVVGRDFLYRIVNEVSGGGSDLQSSLAVLERVDLIREKSPDPDLEYFFKHALTQEVAYDGLLKSERQELHGRVARAMESQLSHRKGEFIETLAHHWRCAGELEQAVGYLRIAGKKAMERYSLDEADHHFRQAYDLVIERERGVAENKALAETLIDWMLVFYYQDKLAEARELLERHEADFESTGDDELIGMSLAWRGNADWIGSRIRSGIELLDRAIAIGERSDNAVVLAHAITWKAWALYLGARPREAIQLGERIPALIDRNEDRTYLTMKSRACMGFANVAAGNYRVALGIADDLEEIGLRSGSSRALAMCQGIRSNAANICGDHARAIDEGRRGIEAARDPIYRCTVRATLYPSLAGSNNPAALRAELDASRDEMATTFSVMQDCAEGLCLILEGQPAKGLQVLKAALSEAEAHDVSWVTAIVDGYLAIMYARIATREVATDIGVALRNPGFLLKHGLPARRKAHRAFRLFEENYLDTDRLGVRFLFNFEWAKLLASEGKTAEAARRVRIALDNIANYGPSDEGLLAQALLDRLEQRAEPAPAN